MTSSLWRSSSPGEQRQAPGFDTSVAHVARVYNYRLGGKDDFAAARVSQLLTQRVRPRSHDEVTRFFDGLELVEPGVVPIQQWRPESDTEAAARAGMWGGVGRKP
jgi:hypothetical protein